MCPLCRKQAEDRSTLSALAAAEAGMKNAYPRNPRSAYHLFSYEIHKCASLEIEPRCFSATLSSWLSSQQILCGRALYTTWTGSCNPSRAEATLRPSSPLPSEVQPSHLPAWSSQCCIACLCLLQHTSLMLLLMHVTGSMRRNQARCRTSTPATCPGWWGRPGARSRPPSVGPMSGLPPPSSSATATRSACTWSSTRTSLRFRPMPSVQVWSSWMPAVHTAEKYAACTFLQRCFCLLATTLLLRSSVPGPSRQMCRPVCSCIHA